MNFRAPTVASKIWIWSRTPTVTRTPLLYARSILLKGWRWFGRKYHLKSLHFVIWDSRDGLELASTSDIGDLRINHFFKIRLRYSLKRTKHASYWFKFCNPILNLFVADKTWGRAVCWRLYQGNEEFPLEWVNVSFSRLNGPEALSF